MSKTDRDGQICGDLDKGAKMTNISIEKKKQTGQVDRISRCVRLDSLCEREKIYIFLYIYLYIRVCMCLCVHVHMKRIEREYE